MLIVVAGIGVATVLSFSGGMQRWLGIAAVVALVVSLAPYTRGTLRTDHGLVSQARHDALVLDRLGAVIADDGGAKRLLACGRPVTRLTYQSTVAWELGLNVGTVITGGSSRTAGRWSGSKPRGSGWIVRVINAPGGAAGCSRLNRSDI